MHVHVKMPGLLPEDDQGQLRSRGETRSLQRVVVEEQDPDFQRALRALIAGVNGEPCAGAVLPVHVWRANSITLKWHNREGVQEYKEVWGTVVL